jgi:hypothetical protein
VHKEEIMADDSYSVEVKLASKNGWFTPTESQSYYGRYGRDGITVHWWGDGTGASNHDNIVNYMNAQAEQGNKSVNYVLSDNKITLCVSPDNVAWCSQSGNATTISVETQPTLGAEGYKKWGWLVDQLEQRYGKTLPLYKHSYWFQSACPGTIDLNRIRSEANKWKFGGEYNPAPKPVPAPAPVPQPTQAPQVVLTITDIPNKKVRLVRDTNLWDLHFAKYADAKAVKSLTVGTEVEVSAIAKHPLGSEYYLSEYSYAKGIGNGINIKDCIDITPPQPAPTPIPVPVPIPVLTTEQRLSALEALVAKIIEFITNLGFKR